MTDTPQTIAEFWQTYRDDVVPGNAPEIQVVECRQAFYAGASSLLAAMMDAADHGDGTNGQGTRRMEDLAAELTRFALGAMTGTA